MFKRIALEVVHEFDHPTPRLVVARVEPRLVFRHRHALLQFGSLLQGRERTFELEEVLNAQIPEGQQLPENRHIDLVPDKHAGNEEVRSIGTPSLDHVVIGNVHAVTGDESD